MTDNHKKKILKYLKRIEEDIHDQDYGPAGMWLDTLYKFWNEEAFPPSGPRYFSTPEEMERIQEEMYQESLKEGKKKGEVSLMDFPSIVKNETTKFKGTNPANRCPICNSGNITVTSSTHTLVGGDTDTNHYWVHSHCNECTKDYCMEFKQDIVWYTSDGKVLRGAPNCSEKYFLDCSLCNGEHTVTKQHRHLDGSGSDIQMLSSSIFNNYRTFYKCSSCGEEEETQKSVRMYRTALFYQTNKEKIDKIRKDISEVCNNLNSALVDYVQQELGDTELDDCSYAIRDGFRCLWGYLTQDPVIHMRWKIVKEDMVHYTSPAVLKALGDFANKELCAVASADKETQKNVKNNRQPDTSNIRESPTRG